MEMEFKTKKLKKQCEIPYEAQKVFGAQIGNKLTQRVNEIKAAENLNDIAKNFRVNGFHSLGGDRKDEFAVYLVHPHRLVFKVKLDSNCNTVASYKDIEFVRIEEVIDYHGKNKK